MRYNLPLFPRHLRGQHNISEIRRQFKSLTILVNLIVLSLGYLSQLDERAKVVSAVAYADSTLNTRRSTGVFTFTSAPPYGLVPNPAQRQTIVRFLIHLSTSYEYGAIINYLSAINDPRQHFGRSVTFQEVFKITLVTLGLRRILGDVREQKFSMSLDILRRICPLLFSDVD